MLAKPFEDPVEVPRYLDDAVKLCQSASSPWALQRMGSIEADDEVRERHLCCER